MTPPDIRNPTLVLIDNFITISNRTPTQKFLELLQSGTIGFRVRERRDWTSSFVCGAPSRWIPNNTSRIDRRKQKKRRRNRIQEVNITFVFPHIATGADKAAGTNPKAFAVANPGKLARQAARSHDVCQLKILLLPC